MVNRWGKDGLFIKLCVTVYVLSTSNVFIRISTGMGRSRNIKQRRQWHPTPVLLPGKSHGQKSLVGCHLWGRTELDTTEET